MGRAYIMHLEDTHRCCFVICVKWLTDSQGLLQVMAVDGSSEFVYAGLSDGVVQVYHEDISKQ